MTALQGSLITVAAFVALFALRKPILGLFGIHIMSSLDPGEFFKAEPGTIARYLQMVVQSRAQSPWMTITTLRDQGLSVHREGAEFAIQFMFLTKVLSEREIEGRVRAFFHNRGIEPTEDVVNGNLGMRDETRTVTYPVPSEPETIVPLVQEILLKVIPVGPEEPLEFSFNDRF